MEIAIIIIGLIAALVMWRVYVIRKKHKAIDKLTNIYMRGYEVPDKYYLHVKAVVDTAYNMCNSKDEFEEHVKWRIAEIKSGSGIDNNGNADTGEAL